MASRFRDLLSAISTVYWRDETRHRYTGFRSRSLPTLSVRVKGENVESASLLAQLEPLPPIIVHRPTMRIMEGMHRVRAELRGDQLIGAVFFDGGEDDAFVLAEFARAAGILVTASDVRARLARCEPSKTAHQRRRGEPTATGNAAAVPLRNVTSEPSSMVKPASSPAALASVPVASQPHRRSESMTAVRGDTSATKLVGVLTGDPSLRFSAQEQQTGTYRTTGSSRVLSRLSSRTVSVKWSGGESW